MTRGEGQISQTGINRGARDVREKGWANRRRLLRGPLTTVLFGGLYSLFAHCLTGVGR